MSKQFEISKERLKQIVAEEKEAFEASLNGKFRELYRNKLHRAYDEISRLRDQINEKSNKN